MEFNISTGKLVVVGFHKTKYACVVEADKRRNNTSNMEGQSKKHEDHIAGKGMVRG